MPFTSVPYDEQPFHVAPEAGGVSDAAQVCPAGQSFPPMRHGIAQTPGAPASFGRRTHMKQPGRFALFLQLAGSSSVIVVPVPHGEPGTPPVVFTDVVLWLHAVAAKAPPIPIAIATASPRATAPRPMRRE